MPELTVKHKNLDSDEAAQPPPKREPVEQGDYHAVIGSVKPGVTNFEPALEKITIEYKILHDDKNDTKRQGRSVWQDYITEPDPDEHKAKRSAYEIRRLFEATGTPFTVDPETKLSTFNTDHLINKPVKITVRHRLGNKIDPSTGQFPVFHNVVKVDTVEDVDDEDLV